MSKRKRNESSRDEETYVAKKNGKVNIFAFILCVLIAFIIWLYASNLEKKNKEENGTNGGMQSAMAMIDSETAI